MHRDPAHAEPQATDLSLIGARLCPIWAGGPALTNELQVGASAFACGIGRAA